MAPHIYGTTHLKASNRGSERQKEREREREVESKKLMKGQQAAAC